MLAIVATAWLLVPFLALFDAPARGGLEFWDETYLAKTRGMGLS